MARPCDKFGFERKELANYKYPQKLSCIALLLINKSHSAQVLLIFEKGISDFD